MSYKKVKTEKQTNRGKPENIKQTKLDVPRIWTNFYESSQLIKLFYERGRHVSLHQAGRDYGKKALKDKKLYMKENADCYAKAQNIAMQLFSLPKTQKRLTVFFFRLPDEECCDINEIPYLDQKLSQVLNQIHFLLKKSFIKDLIKIALSEDINIVDELLQDKHPKEFSQLLQNAYIANIIEKMKVNNSTKTYDDMNLKQLKEDFRKFVKDEQTKNYIIDFIKEIKYILYSNNVQTQNEYDFQNAQNNDFEGFFNNDDNQSWYQGQYQNQFESEQIYLGYV